MANNPFLSAFDTPFETVPFDKIEIAHYLPAIEQGIKEGKEEIDQIVSNTEAPTFENTVEAMERCGKLLGQVAGVFFNMNSAETNEEIQALAQQISPKLTEYSNDIMLNEELFKRVEAVYQQKDQLGLNPEQTMLLEKSYKSFVRNGALLNTDEKEKLRSIDVEKSQLSLKFGENVLADNNEFQLHITDEAQLAGLPDGIKEAASMAAKVKGHETGWVFTLDYPSYGPFVTYADNRELREKMSKAYGAKAFNSERDNQENVKRIALLRHQRALLLGYESHAHYVLAERMAESPENVFGFLEDILKHALPHAKQELSELTDFGKGLNGPAELQRWDGAYYSEKLKKEKFSIDDELLKPYFKLENVVEGVFETATRLYGLTFEKNDTVPVYHEDVTAYEVKDSSGAHLAVFYADFFPRAGKRQGAWMTSFRDQYKVGSEDHRPHVSIVCNFTKPTGSKPSLLTFNEVTTLFHEFGHALHGMLANGTYGSLSGTSVYWDFVELPSQVLENWCYEKECLDLFAKHYETGESIPEEYIQRIKDSANFHSGMMAIRQVGLGLLDMSWHSQDTENVEDVKAFEQNVMSRTDLYPPVSESCMSTQFSHIFQGGYSSGYYSYKWAEVLDADAFEAFKEKGIFNKEVADSFRENILSAGGSEHPAILYRRFRGRDADPKALLRREGLISETVTERGR